MNTYKITKLDKDKTYTARAEKLFEFQSSDPNHNIVQGSVFDGGTFYVALNSMKNGCETTRIVVLDKCGKVLRESPVLELDHANALTLAPDGKLFVTHCQSKDGHYNRYSSVDAESFVISKTADLEKPFFAMAYCAKAEHFGSGQWSGQTLNVWDKDLRLIKNADVEMPRSLSQGLCCTEDGLYFIRSDKDGFPSEIRHYSWELELIRTVTVDFPEGVEAEDISIVDGEVYIGANTPKRIATVYKLCFTPIVP